jgi:putative heme transporter
LDRGEEQDHHRGWSKRLPGWFPSPKLVLAALIVGAFVFLGYRVRNDFETAYDHLSVARLPWLLAAIGAEVASFVCYAVVQRRLLHSGGAKITLRTMLGLAVAATGLTNLLPGGTAPASGWLVNQYRRRGIPMPLALWSVLVGGFAAAISILILLLAGAAVAGLIDPWETLGCAAVMVLVVAGILLSVRNISAVDRWLDRHETAGSRILEKGLDQISKVTRFRTSVPGGFEVLALSIANWGLDTICLIAAFEVLGFGVPWRAVLFAYATAQVAGSLAPLPGGIGFVEGGMTGAFALAGSPTGDAFVATLVYRLVTCWGVAAVGSIALVILNSRRPRPVPLHGEALALHRRGSRK